MHTYLMIHNVLVHYISPTEADAGNTTNLFYGYTSNNIDDMMTLLYVGILLVVNGLFLWYWITNVQFTNRGTCMHTRSRTSRRLNIFI